MGVSFLELLKNKRKKAESEILHSIYQTTYYFLLCGGSFSKSGLFKVCGLLPKAPFLPNSPDPSCLHRVRGGLQRKEAVETWRRKWLSGSSGGREDFSQESEYKGASNSFHFQHGKSCEGTTSWWLNQNLLTKYFFKKTLQAHWHYSVVERWPRK